MKSWITYLTLALLIVTACKKESIKFTLEGDVTDTSLNQNHVNASVQLYRVPVGGGTEELMGSTSVNTDGKFSITFERSKAEKYHIVIKKDNYFDIDQTILFNDFQPNKAISRTFKTTAKAYVKLVFHNSDPSDLGRYIKYNIQKAKSDCHECCPKGTQYQLAGFSDTTIYCMSDGNTEYSYYYELFPAGQVGIESKMTIPFDTITIYKEL